MTGEFRECLWCGTTFERKSPRGPAPLYCCRSHRQRAHEHKKAIKLLGGAGGVARLRASATAAAKLGQADRVATLTAMGQAISKSNQFGDLSKVTQALAHSEQLASLAKVTQAIAQSEQIASVAKVTQALAQSEQIASLAKVTQALARNQQVTTLAQSLHQIALSQPVQSLAQASYQLSESQAIGSFADMARRFAGDEHLASFSRVAQELARTGAGSSFGSVYREFATSASLQSFAMQYATLVRDLATRDELLEVTLAYERVSSRPTFDRFVEDYTRFAARRAPEDGSLHEIALELADEHGETGEVEALAEDYEVLIGSALAIACVVLVSGIADASARIAARELAGTSWMVLGAAGAVMNEEHVAGALGICALLAFLDRWIQRRAR